jgi:hypothetical protein
LLAKNSITFRLGTYDHTRDLVIDPTLAYSTYLGGSATDEATAIAVAPSGNVSIAGFTASTDFPVTSGAFQTVNHKNPAYFYAPNAFITS